MLHRWYKILLKSDINCLSYNKVHRGLLFSGHSVVTETSNQCSSGHCRTSRYHWRHELPHSTPVVACQWWTLAIRPARCYSSHSQHEMWRGRVQVFADSVSSDQSILLALELTCNTLSSQMDRTDSPKRIWNQFRFDDQVTPFSDIFDDILKFSYVGLVSRLRRCVCTHVLT